MFSITPLPCADDVALKSGPWPGLVGRSRCTPGMGDSRWFFTAQHQGH